MCFIPVIEDPRAAPSKQRGFVGAELWAAAAEQNVQTVQTVQTVQSEMKTKLPPWLTVEQQREKVDGGEGRDRREGREKRHKRHKRHKREEGGEGKQAIGVG